MDSIIAEYNNMWSKLNLIAEHHNNLFVFTLTTSGAILTFAIQQNNSYFAVINMIILILLRCRVMNYRDDYYKTLAYIRTVIEPKLKLDSNLLREIDSSKVSNLHYFVYSVLGIGTIITCCFVDNNKFVLGISAIFLICIILLDIYYFFYSKRLYDKYEKIFMSIIQK